jgi:DNA-binding Lrp family transcriptional regulator
MARISNTDNILCREIHFPPCDPVLSEEDLALVICIQTDPTKPYTRISTETGLSSRAVKRRLERMLQERALFTIPTIDPTAFTGGTLAELLVFFESPETMRKAKSEITARIGEYLIWAQLADRDHILFQLVITNISQVKTILSWVKRQPGVKYAFLDLVEERVELYEALTHQLRRKLIQVRGAGGGRIQPITELGIPAKGP